MAQAPIRRVDWNFIEGTHPARARVASRSKQPGGLAPIAPVLESNPSAKTIDRVLRKVVEFARVDIGLDRVAIFLLSPGGRTMTGTWGTDMAGRTSDEHAMVYRVNQLVRQSFARTRQGYAWVVYENCPLVTHEGGRSHTVGRGWNAYTAIKGAGAPFGMLFNDSAISSSSFDESKQARVAVLCSLLGHALESCYLRLFEPKVGEGKTQHPLVQETAGLLDKDPTLSLSDLAARLEVSQGHLTRTFRRCAHTSIVEYRNELRLNQFLVLVKDRPVLDAVLAAGFGSYAQFNRVFRARFGKKPRDYLFEQRLAQRRQQTDR